MKKLLFIIACLLPTVVMTQQIDKNVTSQIHKQIAVKARLQQPFFFVGGTDQIKAQRADSIALRLKIMPSGRVKLLDIAHASYPAINEVVCDAASRVRLPKGSSNDGEVIVQMTLGFRDTLVPQTGGYIEVKQVKMPWATTHYSKNNTGHYTMEPARAGASVDLVYNQAVAQGKISTTKPIAGSDYVTLTFVMINKPN